MFFRKRQDQRARGSASRPERRAARRLRAQPCDRSSLRAVSAPDAIAGVCSPRSSRPGSCSFRSRPSAASATRRGRQECCPVCAANSNGNSGNSNKGNGNAAATTWATTTLATTMWQQQLGHATTWATNNSPTTTSTSRARAVATRTTSTAREDQCKTPEVTSRARKAKDQEAGPPSGLHWFPG